MFNTTHYRQANTSEIHEKMLYYKHELEKRETSYDKAFFPKGGGDQGLRVSQRGNEESKNVKSSRSGSRTSTKGRGNSVAGTTKKLPKIM